MRTKARAGSLSAMGLLAGALVYFLSFGAPATWAQGGPIIEVRAAKPDGLLAEGLADKIRSIEGVKGVEKYILKQADPHPVIGVEPGAPLRVLERGKLLSAEKGTGRWLRPGDRYAAIVGDVYREDYTGFSGMGMMRTMRHRFEVGSSFPLRGAKRRIRVVGKFAVEPASAAKKIVLPLAAVQEIFNLEGQVTHLLVTPQSSEIAQKVSESIRSSLGEGVSVRVH